MRQYKNGCDGNSEGRERLVGTDVRYFYDLSLALPSHSASAAVQHYCYDSPS